MGNCASLSSNKQVKETGISSQSYHTSANNLNIANNNNKNNDKLSSNTKFVKNKTKISKTKRKVHKGIISLPSNFQHTGHIGITELRSGKVDPEKIKKQMAEVAATLNIDFANTVSIDDDNDISTTTTTLSSNQNSEITDQSAKEFKIKRKSTLSTTTSIPVLSSQSSQSTNELIVDPMKKVFAALRMPSDGNFDSI
nr:11748_t:CDS:2 [Entrophospora candida]